MPDHVQIVKYFISVLESFIQSLTASASSGSRFSIIFVLLLLTIPLPYLPSSRAKKSERSCVAAIAAPP